MNNNNNNNNYRGGRGFGGRGSRQGRGGRQQRRNNSQPYYRSNRNSNRRFNNNNNNNNRNGNRSNQNPSRTALTYERSYKSATELGEVEIYVIDPRDHDARLKTKIYPIDGLHFDQTVLAFHKIERLANSYLELSPDEHFMALEEAVAPPANAYLETAQQELESELEAKGVDLDRDNIEHYQRLKRLFFRSMSVPLDARAQLIKYLKNYKKPRKVSVTEHKNKAIEIASIAQHMLPDTTSSDEMIEWTQPRIACFTFHHAMCDSYKDELLRLHGQYNAYTLNQLHEHYY